MSALSRKDLRRIFRMADETLSENFEFYEEELRGLKRIRSRQVLALLHVLSAGILAMGDVVVEELGGEG